MDFSGQMNKIPKKTQRTPRKKEKKKKKQQNFFKTCNKNYIQVPSSLRNKPSLFVLCVPAAGHRPGAPAEAGHWAGQLLASCFVSSHHGHSLAETEPHCHLRHGRPQRRAQCSARPGLGETQSDTVFVSQR